MEEEQTELTALRESIEDRERSFPKEYLGVGDKFLLRQIINDTLETFRHDGKSINHRSYAFIYTINEQMGKYGYKVRDLEPLV